MLYILRVMIITQFLHDSNKFFFLKSTIEYLGHGHM